MGAGGRVRRAGSRAVREDEGREHLAIKGATGPAGARSDAGSRGRGLYGTRGERKRRRAASRGRDRGAGGAFRRAFWAMWSRPPRKGPFWLDGVSEPP